MTHIFLDFDRTLFDTNHFYNEHEHFLFAGYTNPHFTDNFDRFLYPDVLNFLLWCRKYSHLCHLLTFGSREVQEPKFELCEIRRYFMETFYVEQGRKVDAVYDYINQQSNDKIVFIDDTMVHLEAFHVKLPQTTCLLMRRNGKIDSNSPVIPFPVIESLDDAKMYV